MTTTMQAIGSLVIDTDTPYRNYGYETASAYDDLVLKAGTYPFRLTTIKGTPWVPGARSFDSVMPAAPYYAVADVNALLVQSYYENRLFHAVKAQTTKVDKMVTHHVQLYAYEIGKRKTWGTIGRIVTCDEFRADTYPCIQRLTFLQYQEVLAAAVRWLAQHDHGNYSDDPAWHVWNQIEAKALAGVEGFVKAALEGYVR